MSLSLILKDGKLLLKDGVPVAGDPGLDGFGNCCCEVTKCNCECFEVSVNGKWGIQDSEFLDEEHPEQWESIKVYNCGDMVREAFYHRYNYPFGNAFTYARVYTDSTAEIYGGITINTIAACGEVNGTRAARWTFGQDGCPNGVEYLDDECYSTWYPELPSCDATTLEEARQINCAWYTGNRPEITVRPCSSSSSSSGGGE